MAADINLGGKLEFQSISDKEMGQENDFGDLCRFGSPKVSAERKTEPNINVERTSLDEFSIMSTLSRLRKGFTSGQLSLKRPSLRKSSPVMRRLSGSQVVPRRLLNNRQGSLKPKLRKSLMRSLRSGTDGYCMTLRSTPRRIQYMQLLATLRQKSREEGNGQDDPLQQMIEHEMKMTDGIAKLVAANRNPGVALEAGKSFLTSAARLDAYVNELKMQKTVRSTDETLDGGQELKPCRATVTISDLRIPLVWKDVDHFMNKTDRHYAAFCLLHLGSTVCDTSLLFDIDRKTTELSFDDVITFEAVGNKFEVQLEVFLHRISQDLRLPFTPLKNSRRLSDISTSIGKRLSGIAEEAADQRDMLIGPKFDCIARATLTMKDAAGFIDCYDLSQDPQIYDGTSATSGLMLFGNFCCRLTVQPCCLNEEAMSGWLSVRSESELEWQRFWCCLECNELLGWSQMDAVNTSAANFRVSLDQETSVQGILLESDKGVNRIIVTTKLAADRVLQHEITSDRTETLEEWKKALRQRICNFREWKNACKSVIQVPETPFKFKTLGRSFSVKRNEPLVSTESPMTRILTRLNINTLPTDTSENLRLSSAQSSFSNTSNVFV